VNELVFALTVFIANPPLQAVNGVEPRSHFEIGRYDTRTECDIEARSVRVHHKGAVLRCVPRHLSPDERWAAVRQARQAARAAAERSPESLLGSNWGGVLP
jgi:hypothetical protein